MSHICLVNPEPQSISALCPLLISHLNVGRRRSGPGWLVT